MRVCRTSSKRSMSNNCLNFTMYDVETNATWSTCHQVRFNNCSSTGFQCGASKFDYTSSRRWLELVDLSSVLIMTWIWCCQEVLNTSARSKLSDFSLVPSILHKLDPSTPCCMMGTRMQIEKYIGFLRLGFMIRHRAPREHSLLLRATESYWCCRAIITIAVPFSLRTGTSGKHELGVSD